MQKYPMLSVKEAAEALKLDERSVRERLANGTLKGEKKAVGLRDKWFVYSGAVESALAKQTSQDYNSTTVVKPLSDAQDTFDAQFIEDVEVTSQQAPSSTPRREWYPEDRERLESIVEQLMKPLVDKVAAQASVLAEQEKLIEQQKLQLRLLPDLEKRAEAERRAAELKELEAIALKKQVDSIAEEKSKVIKEKEAELQVLQKRAEEEKVLAAQAVETSIEEIEALNKRVAAMEEEKKLLEIKATEAVALANDLQALKKTVDKLQQPWWKKVFGS